MHAFAAGQRRELVENGVAQRGASIALTCQAFRGSETCYRYRPKLRAENEEIANLLTGLIDALKRLKRYKPDALPGRLLRSKRRKGGNGPEYIRDKLALSDVRIVCWAMDETG